MAFSLKAISTMSNISSHCENTRHLSEGLVEKKSGQVGAAVRNTSKFTSFSLLFSSVPVRNR